MQTFLLLTAAAALPVPPPTTAEQAVERQRAIVRDAVANPCGRGDSIDEIVVCGQQDRSVPERRRPGDGFEPSWEAPAEGPWFSFNRGPLSLTCCSVQGSRGSGAGLGLRIRF
ncbi:MAG TPA: hypothetical protein VF552_14295 [Allosphingosinicella sp.]